MKKLTYLLILFLAFSSNSIAQKLAGSYCEDFDYIAEHDSKYGFDLNGHFYYQFWDDVEEIFGSGSYFLRNDSLILTYKPLPKEAKDLRVTSEVNEKNVSTFYIVSPVSSMPFWKCSYQVFEGDSLIAHGEGDQYAYFETKLEVGQTLKASAYLTDRFDKHLGPIQFEINGQKFQQDYAVIATGIRKNARIISSHSKGFPIRLKERGKRFGLKVNHQWIWYKFCN